jgi:hypothetical protein
MLEQQNKATDDFINEVTKSMDENISVTKSERDYPEETTPDDGNVNDDKSFIQKHKTKITIAGAVTATAIIGLGVLKLLSSDSDDVVIVD